MAMKEKALHTRLVIYDNADVIGGHAMLSSSLAACMHESCLLFGTASSSHSHGPLTKQQHMARMVHSSSPLSGRRCLPLHMRLAPHVAVQAQHIHIIQPLLFCCSATKQHQLMMLWVIHHAVAIAWAWLVTGGWLLVPLHAVERHPVQVSCGCPWAVFDHAAAKHIQCIINLLGINKVARQFSDVTKLS